MNIDFNNVTACGGDCTGCEHFKDQECRGCNINGGLQVCLWHNGCRICECCQEHNVKFCGLCSEFPCEWLEKTLTWHEDGIERLRKYAGEYIRRNGNGQA